MTKAEAWAEYFAANPEVLASWRHQNGYWPEDSDPAEGDEE